MSNDYLKMDDGQRSPKGQALNKMVAGYEAIAKDNDEAVTKPTVAETLKKRHDEGYELNGIELLIVGQYEADLQREDIDSDKLREAESQYHNE